MKAKKIAGALIIALTMGVGVIAYADTTQNENSATQNNCVERREGFRKLTNKRGYEIMEDVLSKRLQMSKEDIQKLKAEGKSYYEIAKEKGVTDEELRTLIKNERISIVDEAVKEGKITKEEGDKIKEKIENNNCEPGKGMNKKGKGEGQGQGRGQGKGQGKGKNQGFCELNNK